MVWFAVSLLVCLWVYMLYLILLVVNFDEVVVCCCGAYFPGFDLCLNDLLTWVVSWWLAVVP